MAQGLVLALGTYRRIAIHVAFSGLSDLRIVGILGTTLVVAGGVAVALKLRRRHTFTWRERDVATLRTLASLEAAGPEIATTLGPVEHAAARQVLLELSRVANEGTSLEELLAVPDAEGWVKNGNTRRRGDY